MKKIFLRLLFLSVIIMYGCEKKSKCPEAPTNAIVSWSEYNSPVTLNEYFLCNNEALLKHSGDTIRLWGWAYYRDPEGTEPDFTYDSNWTAYRDYIYLVPNENHHGYNQMVWVRWDKEWRDTNSDFRQSFDEYLSKKWYVVATIGYKNFHTECCNLSPLYNAIYIDTVKDRN